MRCDGRWWMNKLSVFSRFFIVLGVLALVSCGDGRNKAEVSYHFDLSPSQVIEFKSDLREFALQNQYAFIDGSAQTKEAREYINRESERSSQKSAGLVSKGSEVIDVTVEPEKSGLTFFIFVKTSAYDAKKISLTMVHNKNSAIERAMADNFSQSLFLRKWKQ
jgi:hypothetical protein